MSDAQIYYVLGMRDGKTVAISDGMTEDEANQVTLAAIDSSLIRIDAIEIEAASRIPSSYIADLPQLTLRTSPALG